MRARTGEGSNLLKKAYFPIKKSFLAPSWQETKRRRGKKGLFVAKIVDVILFGFRALHPTEEKGGARRGKKSSTGSPPKTGALFFAKKKGGPRGAKPSHLTLLHTGNRLPNWVFVKDLEKFQPPPYPEIVLSTTARNERRPLYFNEKGIVGGRGQFGKTKTKRKKQKSPCELVSNSWHNLWKGLFSAQLKRGSKYRSSRRFKKGVLERDRKD